MYEGELLSACAPAATFAPDARIDSVNAASGPVMRITAIQDPRNPAVAAYATSRLRPDSMSLPAGRMFDDYA